VGPLVGPPALLWAADLLASRPQGDAGLPTQPPPQHQQPRRHEERQQQQRGPSWQQGPQWRAAARQPGFEGSDAAAALSQLLAPQAREDERAAAVLIEQCLLLAHRGGLLDGRLAQLAGGPAPAALGPPRPASAPPGRLQPPGHRAAGGAGGASPQVPLQRATARKRRLDNAAPAFGSDDASDSQQPAQQAGCD
jgi:hypothetical protein